MNLATGVREPNPSIIFSIFYFNYFKDNPFDFFRVYQGQKKSKEALPHYQEALEYIEISKGEKSLECVPTLRELASVEQALGFHDASINHLLQVSCNVLATKAVPVHCFSQIQVEQQLWEFLGLLSALDK